MKESANKGSAKTSPRNAGGGGSSAAEAVQRELKTLARHTEQVRHELHACSRCDTSCMRVETCHRSTHASHDGAVML